MLQVEVKVAQTKEALAQQADKARAVVYNHGYGMFLKLCLFVFDNFLFPCFV